MGRRVDEAGKTGWGIAGALAPAAVVAAVIACYGVNVPFWDDWFTGALLARWHAGTVGIGALWAQHNESRPVVPRLIEFVIGATTGWDRRAAMWVSWAVAVATAWVLARVGRRTVGPGWAWAAGVAGIYLFSLGQYVNWLWGFQVLVLLPGLMLAVGLWIGGVSGWPWRWRVAGTLVAAGVGTVSFVTGWVLWVLLPMGLWGGSRRAERRGRGAIAWGVWAATGAGLAGLYFRGFHGAATSPDLLPMVFHTPQRARYIATYLGMPVGWAMGGGAVATGTACMAAGTGMLALLAGLMAYVAWRREESLERRALPWLAACGYAVAGAVAGTFLRPNPGEAMALRYLSNSVWLPVGLSYLTAVVVTDLRGRGRGLLIVRSARVLAVAAVAVGIYGDAVAWGRAGAAYRQRLHGLAALELYPLDVRPVGTAVLDPFHDTATFPHRAAELRAAGLLAVHVKQSRDVKRWAGGTAEGLARVTRDRDGITVRGWAVLPGHRPRGADAVVIAADMGDGQSVAVDVVAEFAERDDVGRRLGAACARSGFTARVETARWPAGAVGVSVWAYDALVGKAHRLPAAQGPTSSRPIPARDGGAAGG